MESQAGKLDLKITSDPANLRAVRKQVEALATSGGLPQGDAEGVGLALNEALANIIRHGYGGAVDKPIHLIAEAGHGEIQIQLRDWGKKFDPKNLPKDIQKQLKPGGLGLLCMRKLMDEAEFIPQPDGMLLKMIKRASTGGANGK